MLTDSTVIDDLAENCVEQDLDSPRGEDKGQKRETETRREMSACYVSKSEIVVNENERQSFCFFPTLFPPCDLRIDEGI